MPNHIRNIVKTSEKTMNKIKEKYFDNGEFSFNKVIPRPKSLDLTSGTITNEAIYYALSKKQPDEKFKVIELLKKVPDIIHGNLWNKIDSRFSKKDLPSLEKSNTNFEPEEFHKELNIKNLEDLGNAYIDNIKNHEYSTWYDWNIENWGTKWDLYRFSCDNTTMIFETAWNPPVPILKFLSKEFPKEIIKLDFASEDPSYTGTLYFTEGINAAYEYNKGDDFADDIWCTYLEIDEPEIEK